jgi:hypothetical protein
LEWLGWTVPPRIETHLCKPPCAVPTPRPTRSPHHAQHGLAKLEFALGVAASGVLIALALAALADLQLLGNAARRVSLAAEHNAASAAQTALQSAPCAPVSPSTPQQGTAASPSASLRSCP